MVDIAVRNWLQINPPIVQMKNPKWNTVLQSLLPGRCGPCSSPRATLGERRTTSRKYYDIIIYCRTVRQCCSCVTPHNYFMHKNITCGFLGAGSHSFLAVLTSSRSLPPLGRICAIKLNSLPAIPLTPRSIPACFADAAAAKALNSSCGRSAATTAEKLAAAAGSPGQIHRRDVLSRPGPAT
jgi:hypothetical protein